MQYGALRGGLQQAVQQLSALSPSDDVVSQQLRVHLHNIQSADASVGRCNDVWMLIQGL